LFLAVGLRSLLGVVKYRCIRLGVLLGVLLGG